MLDLKETINLMMSDNYEDRFKAEYLQLRIRIFKLANILNNWEDKGFEAKCSKDLLTRQHKEMVKYMLILEERAEIEGIDLSTIYI